MQTCNKCFKELPLTEFHKHPGFPLGVRKTCKACACANSKKWYEENREHHLEVCKEWQKNNRPKILENKRKARAERKKRMEIEYTKTHSDRIKARQRLGYLLYTGEVKKLDHCQVCGCHSEEIEGHHYDYKKPGEVIWVCKSCHGWIHRKYRIHEVEKELATA